VAASIRLEGYALHRGVVSAVTLVAREGPIAFEQGDRRADLSALTIRRSDAGVALTDGHGLELDLVEHLLAAFGGLGIRRGVTAIVEGEELPILDGGARTFAEALLALDPARIEEPARLVVGRAASLAEGDSSYVFDFGVGTDVSVEAVFDHPAIGTERASWDGSRGAFLESIAPARTFGFQKHGPSLWQRGRAVLAARSGADPGAAKAFSRAVIVFDEAAAVSTPGEPLPSGSEVARHKLLDLIGDFALYGGPPQGRVFARRPGHTASHRIIREALALGILSPQ
jgi:UDP-3-O-[3-hydroxymyristoyl] N-acetylglucosamine deacetylase